MQRTNAWRWTWCCCVYALTFNPLQELTRGEGAVPSGDRRINRGAHLIRNDADLRSIFGGKGSNTAKDFGNCAALAKKRRAKILEFSR